MSYLRKAFSRIDGESNETVYTNFGMSSKDEGMKCEVIEWVK